MPDGMHWFPAVDVCKELGHTNSRKALADHVPDEHREILETVTGGYGLSIPAGREWRRDLQVISLQGLILLVNACTNASCAPFKQWVAEVKGELREPLESIAARTGLSVRRVNECLRLLPKHACISSRGGAEDDAPVWVLP